MAKMTAWSLELESDATATRKIMKAIKARIEGVLTKASVRIQSRLKVLLKKGLMESPEFISLSRGKLRAELGLPDGDARMVTIINLWVDSIKVKVTKARLSGDTLEASLKITSIRSDWSDVLSLPAARLITEKGEVLPWLQWLLIDGTRIIIREYDISYSVRHHGRSRTGQAIMIKGKGKRWRVPPEFAGTKGNNFVTRVLEKVATQIEPLMEKELKRQVK
tara:strand:+ start:2055 stop:2717 length:663 start_codon:yes stop_codon:yes gene_type:complete